MEIKSPRRKKYARGEPGSQFPIIQTITGPLKFCGKFNGCSVIIEKHSEMEKINSMGCFGKGTLSRNYPTFNKRNLIIVRQRQCDSRNSLLEICPETCKKLEEKTTIIVNDSDSEEDYLNNLKPVLKKQRVPYVEYLNLSLEEAYFLMVVKECLKIQDLDESYLNADTAWTLFSNSQNNFIQNYVVYYFFRTRNWIVKSGLKFGGEYLLYKHGPAYYHASFLVIIDIVKKGLQDNSIEPSYNFLKWTYLIGFNRLTETAAKELIIGQVIWPENLNVEDARKSPTCFKDFIVKPILVRRWAPKIERINYVATNKNKAGKTTDKSKKIRLVKTDNEINLKTTKIIECKDEKLKKEGECIFIENNGYGENKKSSKDLLKENVTQLCHDRKIYKKKRRLDIISELEKVQKRKKDDNDPRTNS